MKNNFIINYNNGLINTSAPGKSPGPLLLLATAHVKLASIGDVVSSMSLPKLCKLLTYLHN